MRRVSTKNISTVQHQNSRPSTKPPRPPSTHTYRLHIIKEQAARDPGHATSLGKFAAERRDYTSKMGDVNTPLATLTPPLGHALLAARRTGKARARLASPPEAHLRLGATPAGPGIILGNRPRPQTRDSVGYKATADRPSAATNLIEVGRIDDACRFVLQIAREMPMSLRSTSIRLCRFAVPVTLNPTEAGCRATTPLTPPTRPAASKSAPE